MKEKMTKIKLKLNRRHPKNVFRVGRHTISNKLEMFEMNEKEMKELQTKGCKSWVISEDQMKKAIEDKKKKED